MQYQEESMQYQEYRYRITPKKKKTDDKVVKHNVVSLRLTDEEKATLENITRATSRNVSDVVREAIDFWLTKGPGVRQKL